MRTTRAFRLSPVCRSPGCCWPSDWRVLVHQTDEAREDAGSRLVFQTPEQLGSEYAWELFYSQATFADAGSVVVAHVVRAVPSIEWIKVEDPLRTVA